jgi:hypothetical protein
MLDAWDSIRGTDKVHHLAAFKLALGLTKPPI